MEKKNRHPNITIENGLYTHCGTRIPLLSGEFHYWRVLRENWPAIIAKIKKQWQFLALEFATPVLPPPTPTPATPASKP